VPLLVLALGCNGTIWLWIVQIGQDRGGFCSARTGVIFLRTISAGHLPSSRLTQPLGLLKGRVALHRRMVVRLLLPLILAGLRQPTNGQQLGTASSVRNAPLNTEQVVQNLVRMNLERAQALHAYHGTRVYRVEYRGFPGNRGAEMVVTMKYESPGTKEFSIQSATGSKLIIDKVLKKLLESEKEALSPEMQRRTALNDTNYEFTLIRYESTSSGSMYVLRVEPKTRDKFLYRGRIWVDAKDFAVVRLEAEPAKNPSFWTKDTRIEQSYMKVSDFWLPARNHSLTSIRLGGQAELTIDYQGYQITGASVLSNLPPRRARGR
jgi:hypothetical protein